MKFQQNFQLIKTNQKKPLSLEMLDICLSHSGINPSLLQCTKVILDNGICNSKFNYYRLGINLKGQKNVTVGWKSLNRTIYTKMDDQVIHNRVYIILLEYHLFNDYAK